MTNIAESLRPNAVPIDSVQHHPDNPRMGDVRAIAESLTRFGQVRPIVVQESTGFIVAGNHTTKAARALGWTEIAIAKVALSDEDAVAYLLADNRLADRGSYDNDVLKELLQRASGNLAGTGYDEDDALAMMDDMPTAIPTESIGVDELRAHDRNTRKHTPEQLAHLTESLKQHGIFREIVVANDGTILAGHGIVEALREMGLRKLPVKRLPYGPNDPEALKVIAADNEIGRLVERDDRALTELLKDVRESGDVSDLLGTGVDAEQLAALVLTTRPESEVADANAAAEWVGMPDFEPTADRIQLILAFDDEAGRDALIEQLGLIIAKKTRKTWSSWWPPRELEDLSSLRFERADSSAAVAEPEPGDGPEGTPGVEDTAPAGGVAAALEEVAVAGQVEPVDAQTAAGGSTEGDLATTGAEQSVTPPLPTALADGLDAPLRTEDDAREAAGYPRLDERAPDGGEADHAAEVPASSKVAAALGHDSTADGVARTFRDGQWVPLAEAEPQPDPTPPTPEPTTTPPEVEPPQQEPDPEAEVPGQQLFDSPPPPQRTTGVDSDLGDF